MIPPKPPEYLDDQMHAYGRELAAAREPKKPAPDAPRRLPPTLTPEEARRRRDSAERDEIYSEGRQHRNLLPNRKT
jgi:hypothetical protein